LEEAMDLSADYGLMMMMMMTTTMMVLRMTQFSVIFVGRIFIKPASLFGLIIAGRFFMLKSYKKITIMEMIIYVIIFSNYPREAVF